jgi:D-alanine-D-alanine ligase
LTAAPPDSPRVAVLYQALPPPTLDGVRKATKPGGYSDSGADIAYALQAAGCVVETPTGDPDPTAALDWVFPDTEEGMQRALRQGADTLWANTVLFEQHPIQAFLEDVWVVGQTPHAQQRFDDKFATNAILRDSGLPVVRSILVGATAGDGVHGLSDLDNARLRRLGFGYPLVVKPVRGRGSQGVTVVCNAPALAATANQLLTSGEFGNLLMIEEYLAGEEVTVTVMPPSSTFFPRSRIDRPWVLPPVRRFNHERGVAPYNGVVAVTRNSAAVDPAMEATPPFRALEAACTEAAKVVEAMAPIRIDCRTDANGVYRIFDLNMKPNMTGACRPGRDDQDSLSAIAARRVGMDYTALLLEMLRAAWRLEGGLPKARHQAPRFLATSEPARARSLPSGAGRSGS